MNDYQTYLYHHFDPRTGAIVYVGIGQNHRAWVGGSLRSKEHANWMKELLDIGYLPSDWVRVVYRQRSKQVALELEQADIEEYTPRFNKLGNPDYEAPSKFTDFLNWFKDLRSMGYSYTHIAFLSGAEGKQSRKNKNAMTIWRAING